MENLKVVQHTGLFARTFKASAIAICILIGSLLFIAVLGMFSGSIASFHPIMWVQKPITDLKTWQLLLILWIIGSITRN